jgi:hypothetical protein
MPVETQEKHSPNGFEPCCASSGATYAVAASLKQSQLPLKPTAPEARSYLTAHYGRAPAMASSYNALPLCMYVLHQKNLLLLLAADAVTCLPGDQLVGP